MNYCRRCGSKLKNTHDHIYKCGNGHTIYANASPATALVLINESWEIATIVRSIEPGKGKLDFPGGFCDGNESAEESVYREVEEEVGVKRSEYSELSYLNSGIDLYSFGNETIPVSSVMFLARCKNDVKLQANDDALEAEFIPINDINIDDVYFDTLKESLRIVRRIYERS